ncbi:MAG: hypothetical protein UZ08_BCD001002131 [Candidatus Parvibacillus calidus]|nr:MAG: hypothetical protein UZ08_BCD001002131 [Candidatus Parvibacillus calidus]
MKLSTFRLLLLIELAISSTSLLNAQAPYFTSVALASREKPLPITEHLKKVCFISNKYRGFTSTFITCSLRCN